MSTKLLKTERLMNGNVVAVIPIPESGGITHTISHRVTLIVSADHSSWTIETREDGHTSRSGIHQVPKLKEGEIITIAAGGRHYTMKIVGQNLHIEYLPQTGPETVEWTCYVCDTWNLSTTFPFCINCEAPREEEIEHIEHNEN